jgi:ABC-2 type transport system permease protein
VTATAQVRQVPLEEELEPKTMHMIVSGVFTFLVFFLIITSGTMLMQSALQEKRDRMAEVVLSSIRPGKLMQGKILGHFVLGIIQLGFWLAIGLPVAKYFLDFPILEALAAVNLPIILFYGLGGYLLFSSLFVSIGSTMEDLQSASNSQGLVVMLPMLSFLFLGPVISNPDGTVALFASLFPFTSPAIMTLRSGLTTVPLWQNLVAGGLLLIATWVTIVMAAKIFRIGMLMYGKNATIQEIFKWLRYKEN